MRGNVCLRCAGGNCKPRDNAPRGRRMSPRAFRWSVCLLLAYMAFLSLLAAVGEGFHL